MQQHDLDTLTADQERAIVALLGQPTVAKAAESLGIHESTLHRWLREPPFARAYARARREVFRHAVALTQRYASHAVQILMKVAHDPAASHAARVSACATVLRFGRESIELDDLGARMEALER
ncbi:MAG TPA: hypothetical protein VHC70_03735, partial [Phycisphaerales bacterium]|nr:hypothetical protein [Phycisphaerales bacterium]